MSLGPTDTAYLSWNILVNGTALTPAPLDLVVVRQLNRIATASLTFPDGDPAASDFPLSSSGVLDPGSTIEISCGYGGSDATVFKGIIFGQRVVAMPHRNVLCIEARDKACAMTLVPRNRLFTNTSDKDIVGTIVAEYGLTASVASTIPILEQTVQRDLTDWSFVLARMRRNGLVVSTEDGTIRIFAPNSQSAVDIGVFGSDLLEVDLALEARNQIAGSGVSSWDYTSQATTQQSGVEPAIPQPGALAAKTLAAAAQATLQLISAQRLAADSEQALANAALLESRIRKVQGRVRVMGRSDITLGTTATIGGCGTRFNGEAMVTGIRHQIVDGVWTTDFEFGRIAPPTAAESIQYPDPAGRPFSLGTVLQLSEDPAGQFRIKVGLPLFQDGEHGVWARVSTLFAGPQNASFFRPDVGDEVLLVFPDTDTAEAIVLGSLNSNPRPSPMTSPDEKNDVKEFRTRSGLTLSFDDGRKIVSISTPAGNSAVLSDEDQSITLKDQNGNSMVFGTEGIKISTPKDLKMTASASLTASADLKMSLSSATIAVSATGELTAEGSASTTVSSDGITSIKGSLVQLN